MSNRRHRVRQADVTRVVKSVKAAGMPVGRVSVDSEGTIHIASADVSPGAEASPLEQWKASRGTR
jgi:hypothetical protein